ncbi:MAG: class I SAM-dependent methyltransferase [Actinomycetes bacterium]
MIEAGGLRTAGTSPAAIEHHYDLSDDFFALWLGDDLVYSCALWDPTDPADSLDRAQQRKLDHFATRLGVGGADVLDIGCGWGGLVDRFVRAHGASSAVGLTLSPAQARFAAGRAVPGAGFHVESWVDHQPVRPYDVITAIESTEHFASDALTADDKVEVYRTFFDRAASWLQEDGRLGLQLICLDGVGHESSRPGRGPLSELIRTEIFPESMPSSLSEMVLGWETQFALAEFLDHTEHYRRTFRAWVLRYRAGHERAGELVGPKVARAFARYFAAGEFCFRTREHALYRVILRKRPQPKTWQVTLWPSALADPETVGRAAEGASAEAVRTHYDVSNDFYAMWLDPTMMYTSGMWSAGDPPDLEAATTRKVDFFADRVLAAPGARVLDVGCGWGGALRRLVDRHGVTDAVGLTLSPAQAELIATDPIAGAQVRVESWTEHVPDRPYDAIVSFGAFEHFARDGTTGPQRVETYRRFFARCYDWLVPGGRLALETIAHDSAPDTAEPMGRGPLGDFVLEIFPESICPHLSEVVLGFEPWFEVELLRSDPGDFARTCRAWQVGLRDRDDDAAAAVGAPTARRFRRYLAASEAQFRTGTITNYRLVLHRRPAVKR